MKFIKSLLRELKATLKSRDVILMLFLGPAALTLIFGGAYVNSYVDDIPVAVFDEDNSSLSRMIIQQLDENDRFSVYTLVDSTEALENLINTKEVSMGVCIPPRFHSDVTGGRSSEVLIIVDGTNMVIGNNSFAAASTIIQTIAAGAEIRALTSRGVMESVSKSLANPFTFNDRMLYNPRLSYMNYLLLGYIAVFLQQVMLSGVGIQMIKDRDRVAGPRIIRETLLKIFSCSFFALTSVAAAISIAALVFRVNIRGSVPVAMVFCLLYTFAISGPAIFIAAVVKDKLKHAQVAYMLSLPAFICCGYVWPQEQMPHMMVLLLKCIWPLIFFARPFDELLFKGIFPAEGFIGLLAYTALWLPVSIAFFKHRHKNTLPVGNAEGCH